MVAAQTEFRGAGFMTNFTEDCASNGWRGVQSILTRFRPAGAPGNDPASNRISVFFPTYSYHLRLPASMPENVWIDALAVGGIGSGAAFETSPSVRPRVRLRPAPAFTATPPDEAHLIAEIDNFDYTPGCRVRANVLLHRR